MFRKRMTVAKKNYLPLIFAFLIPIAASALTMVFVRKYKRPGCSREELNRGTDLEDFTFDVDLLFLAGPTNRIAGLAGALANAGAGVVTNGRVKIDYQLVETFEQFNGFIRSNYSTLNPGGIFLREEGPVIAWRAFYYNGVRSPVLLLNQVNKFIMGANVTTSYQELDMPVRADLGDILQFIIYFSLAVAAFPAFFALYPTIERLRNVRPLHYSNGVRSLPLWLAYTLFDFLLTLIASILVIIIFIAATKGWYNIGYLFVVILLYGLASILQSYVVSLFSKSQLSAFAFTAGGQAVFFLVYFIGYMTVQSNSAPEDVDSQLTLFHFIFAIFTPIASLLRALFVSLNTFNILCRGESVATYPGEMKLYGGPITYLIVQCIFFFAILLWWESGRYRAKLGRSKTKQTDAEDRETVEKEIGDELERVQSVQEGLRVMHVNKKFGKFTAVHDVTFGVPHSEVFALLGPNGAGKTTTINMIRGELYPDSGDVFVENIPVSSDRALARAALGVCPQFDAMDKMTVLEHLYFYARARGVADPEHNVREVMRAVGLQPYGNRMAEALSGGNKRKLSLAIALMGNPTVLLLDEPSSGMDAVSKRVMWRTLAAVAPGRSLVLTTHSMEEADALATRAGILAKRMLALGTTNYLRKKHGNRYFLQLLLSKSDAETVATTRTWISKVFPAADIEAKSFNANIRFSVPITDGMKITELFDKLEKAKQELGLLHYSVAQTSLEDIFLEIVRAEGVKEEGYDEVKKSWWKKLFSTK